MTCSLSRGVARSSSAGTSNPVAHLNTHGSLRVVLSTKSDGIAVVEGSDEGTIDVPLCRCCGPCDAVVVVCFNGCGDILVDCSVVGCGVTLSEEVGFDGVVISTKPFPVYLVEVIRFEDERADDSGSRCSFQEDVDLAEEDVL